MTLLLLGLVVTLAVSRLVSRPETRAGAVRAGAVWACALAILVLGQLVSHRHLLAGYQIRVLGQRFSLSDPSVERTLSGDREAADVYVAGAGTLPVAHLVAFGDTLTAVAGEGSGSVVLVRNAAGAGPEWTVLRSVPLVDGVQVALEGDSTRAEWTFQRRLSAFGLRGTDDSFASGEARQVRIPYPEGAGIVGLFPGRPSIFQRTYPLADLLASFGAPATAALASFVYYEDGNARLAVLDDRITVEASGERVVPAARVDLGRGDGPKARIMVAGLPHRDFPDPRLAPVERYGVRPLRAFDPRVDDGWVTLADPRAGVISLPLAEQDRVVVGPRGQEMVPVSITPGAGDMGPGDGIGMPDFSNRFGAVSQALVRLPLDVDAGAFQLLTPSGLAEWSTARPLTLGDDDRGLLIRVDGLSLSWPLILVLAGLFALAAVPLMAPLSGKVKALALVALGLASVRALLSVAALARYPFVDEGHHISLWLIPALPWFVCALGRVGAGTGGRAGGGAVVPRGFSGGYMGTAGTGSRFGLRWGGRLDPGSAAITVAAPSAVLVLLAFVLFPTSPARAGVLALMTGAVALWTLAAPGGGMGPGDRIPGSLRRLMAASFPGAVAGTVLLLLRGVLELAGYREQISFGGVRVGISVMYTPLAAILFGLILWVHLERVGRSEGDGARKAVAAAWLDLGLFLATAFVGVSLWISDFGIALTALPGLLLILLAAGFHWSRRFGPGAALGAVVPLGLFTLLQVAPGLARPGLSDAAASTRLEDWSRNELLLLERGDPDLLRLIGESRSEALAVMRETMRSYTRGNWMGRGFLEGRVSNEIRNTAVREHAVGGLVASQWGLLGTLGLVLILLAAAAPFVHDLPPGRRRAPGSLWPWVLGVGVSIGTVTLLPSPADLAVLAGLLAIWGGAALAPFRTSLALGPGRRLWWAKPEAEEMPGRGADLAWLIGAAAVATFTFAGLYMVLANYGLVLFTGKNVYLLGLDSVGDTLEAMALLGVATLGLARSGVVKARGDVDADEAPAHGAAPTAKALTGQERRVG